MKWKYPHTTLKSHNPKNLPLQWDSVHSLFPFDRQGEHSQITTPKIERKKAACKKGIQLVATLVFNLLASGGSKHITLHFVEKNPATYTTRSKHVLKKQAYKKTNTQKAHNM